MSETYRSVDSRGEARFEIRGSEFIGHVAPAHTVEEGEAFVDAIREEYADATHNVPAYRIRAEPLREWASDDGEPTNSAGKPALNVLQQENVEDDAGIVERRPHEQFTITAAYDDSGTVRGILESSDVEFEAKYEADVEFAVYVPVEEASALRDRIRSATSDRISFEGI